MITLLRKRSFINIWLCKGFYSLFWVSIFLWTVRTYITSIETNGAPLNLHFATMFSQDAITLAVSDFVLVLSTGLCVPFARAISKGWIRYYWTGIVLQHLLQTTILFTAIRWTFNRCVDRLFLSYDLSHFVLENGLGFNPVS